MSFVFCGPSVVPGRFFARCRRHAAEFDHLPCRHLGDVDPDVPSIDACRRRHIFGQPLDQ
jgi:hypothetical protein